MAVVRINRKESMLQECIITRIFNLETIRGKNGKNMCWSRNRIS